MNRQSVLRPHSRLVCSQNALRCARLVVPRLKHASCPHSLKAQRRASVAALSGVGPLAFLETTSGLAALVEEGSSILEVATITALVLPIALVVGLIGWRFTLYGKLEYITAAMLGRYVPTDGNGAVVVQLGGGTKELYYYPKGTLSVTVVGERLNKALIEQGGASAGVPTTAQVQKATSLSFQPDRSVDAVVSLGAMGELAGDKLGYSLSDYMRVLKPGCPFIFIERLSDLPASPFRSVVGGRNAPSNSLALERLKAVPGWELVQWDIALEGVDPHAVGVALKAETAPSRAAAAGSRRSKGAVKQA